jgi:HlyD family secretion protein
MSAMLTLAPIAAEVGGNVRAGQPTLMVEAAGKQSPSFNAREEH